MAIININEENTNIKDNSQNKQDKRLSKRFDLLDKKMDSLYKDIYISRTDNRDNLNNIINKIDQSLDRLQSSEVSVSGMSDLIKRIEHSSNSKNPNFQDVVDSVEELFNDKTLINTLFTNQETQKFILAENYQIDMIIKYLPKVLEAIEIKRDCVLCSDNFNKQFINPKSIKTNKEELIIFSSNAKRLEDRYDISDFFETTYMNTSKYGEDFIYVVPYNVAFKRLIKRSNYSRNSGKLNQLSFYESADVLNKNGRRLVSSDDFLCCLKESYMNSDEYKNYINNIKENNIIEENKSKFTGCEVNIHFNNTNVILDKINEYTIVNEKSQLEKFSSLNSIYESEYIHEKANDKLNSIFSDVSKTNKNKNISQDGLVFVSTPLEKDTDKIDSDFSGAVLERLPRENIIPIYIGKKCLGYYYFEFKENKNACGFCGGEHMTPGISNSQSLAYNMSLDQQELALRFISSKISNSIDTHFINSNKDLKEEIYTILRYNEKFDIGRANDIGVTFIPAEDIIHTYFELDEKTHRGISDLSKSIVPAMLYILLYLTDIIGKISRSTDKRVYYVKQNIETNTARTMMNVVQQIKKGNMGMRQIESMNNILNIVGKYNDYIIPVGPSGDAPIQFEVMQGQDIQTPTDIMDKMEEAAVNPICPIELVNSAMQQDFATRYTMSSTRFLKNVFTRQRKTEKFFGRIYTKIYNFEYRDNYSFIEIQLPPPTFLTSSNTKQLIDNVSDTTDKIIDMEMDSEDDNVKKEFKKIHIRNQLGTYIDYDLIEKELEQAKINIETDVEVKTADGEESSDFDYT